MTTRYKKHKNWIGKDLTIHVGGGDKKVNDFDLLEGDQYAKFVGMGFLVQISDSPVKAEARVEPKTEPKVEPVPVSGSMTRSTGKVVLGGKTKKKDESLAESTTGTDEPKRDEPSAELGTDSVGDLSSPQD